SRGSSPRTCRPGSHWPSAATALFRTIMARRDPPRQSPNRPLADMVAGAGCRESARFACSLFRMECREMPKDCHQTERDTPVEGGFRRLVRAAVVEDLEREQDWTTVALVPHDSVGAASVVARRDGVVAGLPSIAVLFDETDRRVQSELVAADGQRVQA